MHVTLWTGLFWIIMASIASDTVVKTVRAWRSKPPPEEDAAARELARRVAELERFVEQQAELHRDHEDTVARLQNQVDYTEQLLRGRSDTPRLPDR